MFFFILFYFVKTVWRCTEGNWLVLGGNQHLASVKYVTASIFI